MHSCTRAMYWSNYRRMPRRSLWLACESWLVENRDTRKTNQLSYESENPGTGGLVTLTKELWRTARPLRNRTARNRLPNLRFDRSWEVRPGSQIHFSRKDICMALGGCDTLHWLRAWQMPHISNREVSLVPLQNDIWRGLDSDISYAGQEHLTDSRFQ